MIAGANVDGDTAPSKIANALAVVVDGLGPYMGYSARWAEAAAGVAEAIGLLEAVGGGDRPASGAGGRATPGEPGGEP